MSGREEPEMEMGSPEYMNAYLNGMQFVLMALQGRLEELDEESQEALQEVLHDYHEMTMRMRDRIRLGVSP